MEDRVGTIQPPKMPNEVPKHAQWILGQGAGAWFYINKIDGDYNIKRFAPNGSLDCDRFFEIEDNGSVFDIEQSYQFVHVSHCLKCRIKQGGIVFEFNYIKE